jgi:uncharacterized protein with HEPN domain
MCAAKGRDIFMADTVLQDAAIRNYEVIGEAAKQLSAAILKQAPEVDWRGLKGFRDVLIHAYHNVDLEYVWEMIERKLPELESAVARLIEEHPVDDE